MQASVDAFRICSADLPPPDAQFGCGAPTERWESPVIMLIAHLLPPISRLLCSGGVLI